MTRDRSSLPVARARRRRGRRAEEVAYWQAALAGIAPRLDLPADRSHHSRRGTTYAAERIDVGGDLSASLGELSRSERCPLFVLLTAAFNVLVSRLAGAVDVVMVVLPSAREEDGTGVAARVARGTVLRSDLSGNPRFSELLHRVQCRFEEALDRRCMSLEDLLGALGKADPAMPNVAQVCCGIRASHNVGPILESSKQSELILWVADSPRGIDVTVEYDAALFASERIVEMLRQYLQLLSGISSHPEERIGHYTLVTAHAKRVIPDPAEPLDSAWVGALPDLFRVHACATPLNDAIVDSEGTWTYRRLDEQSDRLARALMRDGVGSGDVVAIYAHRSAALVCAVLAALKAGAAFLILDPVYPALRLTRYLEIARPKAWLHVTGAPAPHEAVAHALDALSVRCRHTVTGTLRDGSEGNATPIGAAPQLGADSPACLVFTSGSSGAPKAVLGTHGSLTHFVPWQRDAFNLSAADRFSMLSGLAHDPLQRDMFTALQLGATMCVPSADEYASPPTLVEWLRRTEVTVAHMTPGILRLMTRHSATPIPALRAAFIVGDVLSRADVKALQTLAPNATCVGLYGATETQRAVGYFVVPRSYGDETNESEVRVPLGVGVPGAQLLVLSPSAGQAGLGEPGEICLRSPHLAKGYAGDSESTRAKFTTNPLTNDARDRVYHTGDLGRYGLRGDVHFLGRADQQVKVRGYRVELGEIEAVLAEHPAVDHALVVARDSPAFGKRLSAYVVGSEKEPATERELREFVGARLPEYMVPSHIVTLQDFPLTPNGKIDRTALPLPDAGPTPELATPRTETEAVLVKIWGEVLGISSPGVHDDFLELGGHSLAAMQIASRIWGTCGVEFSLETLLTVPTIAGLAEEIHRVRELQLDEEGAESGSAR